MEPEQEVRPRPSRVLPEPTHVLDGDEARDAPRKARSWSQLLMDKLRIVWILSVESHPRVQRSLAWWTLQSLLGVSIVAQGLSIAFTGAPLDAPGAQAFVGAMGSIGFISGAIVVGVGLVLLWLSLHHYRALLLTLGVVVRFGAFAHGLPAVIILSTLAGYLSSIGSRLTWCREHAQCDRWELANASEWVLPDVLLLVGLLAVSGVVMVSDAMTDLARLASCHVGHAAQELCDDAFAGNVQGNRLG
jgi:hypothetical protein